jgi:hypothetical protein
MTAGYSANNENQPEPGSVEQQRHSQTFRIHIVSGTI